MSTKKKKESALRFFFTAHVNFLINVNGWVYEQYGVFVVFSSTLLLLSVVHADLKDGWSLVAQQSDSASGGVQLVNAATTVLIPEQEVFIVAQAKGVVQLLTFVHRLVTWEKQQVSSAQNIPIRMETDVPS